MVKAEGSRHQISKVKQTANVPTRPMDADRPIKLSGRVMARAVRQELKMEKTYMFRHIFRAIYVLLASIFSINMIIYAAVITNTTGLFPTSFYQNTTVHNANIRAINILILLIFATAVYLMAEYAISKNIAASSKKSAVWVPSSKYMLFMSYVYFTIFSFLNFLVTLHLISKDFLVIVIVTTLLNLIPIYLIYKLMLDGLQIKKMKAIYWITTVLISVATVYPYGQMNFIRLFIK